MNIVNTYILLFLVGQPLNVTLSVLLLFTVQCIISAIVHFSLSLFFIGHYLYLLIHSSFPTFLVFVYFSFSIATLLLIHSTFPSLPTFLFHVLFSFSFSLQARSLNSLNFSYFTNFSLEPNSKALSLFVLLDSIINAL